MNWVKQSSRGHVEGMNMNGPGKRVHEDFPSVKQHEDHLCSTASVLGDPMSGDKGPYVDAMAESRPSKLPRVDHTNRFQKRMEIDDATINTTIVGTDIKGDGKARPGTDDKGHHVELKGNSFDEKRDIEWSEAHANPLHDSRFSSTDKLGQIHSGNISSAWRRDQWPEKRDDGRAIWKENRDEKSHFKDDAHSKKGDKDGSLDLVHDVRNIGNRSTPWKKDQRFDHVDDMRGPRNDYKWNPGTAHQVIDEKDHTWDESWVTARRSSMEEEGEVRDSEKAVLHSKVEGKTDEKEKDQERKSRDHNQREREDREKVDKSSWWENDTSTIAETEKWDKEKREKALDKKETRHPGEKEKEETVNVKQEAEESDAPKKTISEESVLKENMKLETKTPKDVDVSAALEIDEKEKKDERDHEKLASDALCIDGNEKDKDLNHNFQQKKGVLRRRGHSVVGGRDRFAGKDSDGNQGTPESTAIIYKPGEYMTELLKLWREYESSLAAKNGEAIGSGQGPTIDVRIPAKLVTTSNHQVRGNQLWGTDVYTDDSDLVAVLMHTGYYRPTTSYPPPSVQELCATIQVLSPQDSYVSTLRNNVRSRAWGAASGCSYSVIRCRIVKVCGGHIDLQPCLTRTSAVAPTLAPAVMERTMTTRAASSNAHRQQRFVQEVTIQYNLCNEPWMKYSMSVVADKGLKKSQYTSARLRKGEVLYLETHRKRYELSYDCEKVACNGAYGTTTATSVPVSAVGDKSKDKDHDKSHCNNSEKVHGRGINNNDRGHTQVVNGDGFDHYKWALCVEPLPLKVMLAKGVPLPHEYIEVIENGLAWEEIQWSQAGIWVRGKEYPLTRAHFLSQSPLE